MVIANTSREFFHSPRCEKFASGSYVQEWNTIINNSSKCVLYRTFKNRPNIHKFESIMLTFALCYIVILFVPHPPCPRANKKLFPS